MWSVSDRIECVALQNACACRHEVYMRRRRMNEMDGKEGYH